MQLKPKAHALSAAAGGGGGGGATDALFSNSGATVLTLRA
jgi:hypothetical protein